MIGLSSQDYKDQKRNKSVGRGIAGFSVPQEAYRCQKEPRRTWRSVTKDHFAAIQDADHFVAGGSICFDFQ